MSCKFCEEHSLNEVFLTVKTNYKGVKLSLNSHSLKYCPLCGKQLLAREDFINKEQFDKFVEEEIAL